MKLENVQPMDEEGTLVGCELLGAAWWVRIGTYWTAESGSGCGGVSFELELKALAMRGNENKGMCQVRIHDFTTNKYH